MIHPRTILSLPNECRTQERYLDYNDVILIETFKFQYIIVNNMSFSMLIVELTSQLTRCDMANKMVCNVVLIIVIEIVTLSHKICSNCINFE